MSTSKMRLSLLHSLTKCLLSKTMIKLSSLLSMTSCFSSWTRQCQSVQISLFSGKSTNWKIRLCNLARKWRISTSKSPTSNPTRTCTLIKMDTLLLCTCVVISCLTNMRGRSTISLPSWETSEVSPKP